MTYDLVLEGVRGVVLLLIVVFLYFAGKKRSDISRRGWRLIIMGFGLLLFGSIMDVTDNFESLNRFVVVGDTETQAVLEKMVGFLGGFMLLAIGLLRWIPTVASIDRVKQRTAELQSAHLKLKKELEQRKRLEGQLVQAQKLESIGQLAAGVAHEINTPIQYVGDNTRFLQDSFKSLMQVVKQYENQLDLNAGTKDWQDRFKEIQALLTEIDMEFLKQEIPTAFEQSIDGVGRVAKIVQALKDFSHPGDSEKSLSDLNVAIESTLTVCCSRWKYVAEVDLDLDPNLPLVPCLLNEFNQVILNLIVNAADAIDETNADESMGRISISTHLDDDWVTIRISDTGPGVPQEIRKKIFDPFFTTKDIGKGTGQGLAISYDVVVNKHGGALELETEPGKGSTFIMRLPLACLEQAA